MWASVDTRGLGPSLPPGLCGGPGLCQLDVGPEVGSREPSDQIPQVLCPSQDAGSEPNASELNPSEETCLEVWREAADQALQQLNQTYHELGMPLHPQRLPVEADLTCVGSETAGLVAASLPFLPRRFRRRMIRDRQACQSVDNSFDLLEAVTLDSRPGIPFKGPRVPERQGLDLLEGFAYPGSRLTQAILEAGGRAMRFTALDGDLSTSEGQRVLLYMVDNYKPRHIFVAPECGPWSSWSRFNQSRSTQMFDRVQEQKRAQGKILQLCNRLCEIQIQHSRHFHIEQPSTSTMFEMSRDPTTHAKKNCGQNHILPTFARPSRPAMHWHASAPASGWQHHGEWPIHG